MVSRCASTLVRTFGGMRSDLQDPHGQTTVDHTRADQALTARALLGGLHDHRVATRYLHGELPFTGEDRGIPGDPSNEDTDRWWAARC